MTDGKILDAVEFIDPAYIEEAENYRGRNRNRLWMKCGVLAACLCLCFAGLVKLYPLLQKTGTPDAASESPAEETEEPKCAEPEMFVAAAVPENVEEVPEADFAGELSEGGTCDLPAYSHSTIIVLVDGKEFGDDSLAELCRKYGLTVLYDYDSMNGYAFSLEEELSDEALDELIKEISNEEGILSVERDYIVQALD